jgi:hypothetical protein
MVAGLILAESTGISLKVSPLAELKAALEAQEEQYAKRRAGEKAESAPDASQVA